MNKNTGSHPYDLIWDAIPLFELFDLARTHSDLCHPEVEDKIRTCARQVVKSNICPCCQQDEVIVSSLVDEFIRQMKKAFESRQESELVDFQRSIKHHECSCRSTTGADTSLIGIRARQK